MSCDWKALKSQCPGCIQNLPMDNPQHNDKYLILEGTKYDSEKTRLELLPTEALEEIAKVLAFGAKKYNDWNWAKGMSWSRVIGAALRHLFAWGRGESRDVESGLSHLSHCGCCILFLLSYELKGLGTDDRPKLTNGDQSHD